MNKQHKAIQAIRNAGIDLSIKQAEAIRKVIAGQQNQLTIDDVERASGTTIGEANIPFVNKVLDAYLESGEQSGDWIDDYSDQELKYMEFLVERGILQRENPAGGDSAQDELFPSAKLVAISKAFNS